MDICFFCHLQMDGNPVTTDKDGFSLALLAAEMTAKTGRHPADTYINVLVPLFGDPYYGRNDFILLDPNQAAAFKKNLGALSATLSGIGKVAGLALQEPFITNAPGNNAPMGGLKVYLKDGSWFAVRGSGTEPKGKLYIETWTGGEQLWQAINKDVMPILVGA